MIARSIGAAPRQRGSSDGCTLSSSSSDEQRLADQLAEGADDAELGLGGADPLQRLGLVGRLGLQQLDPELVARPPRPAAGASRAAAPAAAVGRRDDERRAGAAQAASARRTAAAKSEVPR